MSGAKDIHNNMVGEPIRPNGSVRVKKDDHQLKAIGLKITNKQKGQIKELIKKGYYVSFSEAIRGLLMIYLVGNPEKRLWDHCPFAEEPKDATSVKFDKQFANKYLDYYNRCSFVRVALAYAIPLVLSLEEL